MRYLVPKPFTHLFMVTKRSADAPAGYDEDDPYDDIDLKQFDLWRRKNIQLFQKHGMRPYRPPQFADGAHTPELLTTLENELNVSIQFRVVDPQAGNDWTIRIDGEPIGTVERYRDDGGFSVYDIGSEEFEQLVREHFD